MADYNPGSGGSGGLNDGENFDGQGTSDFSNLNSVGTDSALADIIGVSGTTGAIRYASHNHAELPDFQTAVNNADAGDTVVLLPGVHDITSEQTVNTSLRLVFAGTLNVADTGVSIALRLEAACHVDAVGIENGGEVVTSSVADSADGILYHKHTTMTGSAYVTDVGGRGHYLLQREGDDNLNQSQFDLSAVNCGGNGIEIQNTSGGAINMNGMEVRTQVVYGCADGLNIIDGVANTYRLGNMEMNDYAPVRCATRENAFFITHTEGNGNAVTIDGNQNLVWGDLKEGIVDNGAENAVSDRWWKLPVADIPGATATDLSQNQVAMDSTNGRLVWKDPSGTAYYVGGTAL